MPCAPHGRRRPWNGRPTSRSWSSSRCTLYGFIPPEISVAEGLIDLEIVSRVGFPELPILIERDAERNQPKQTLRNENHDARKRKWDQTMLLTPGTYTVNVAGRAKWTAKIIVTERTK